MQPASKLARATAPPSSAPIELGGGLAEKPSAIAKFRDGRLTDVEVLASDGTSFRAHALCLTSGSDYFEKRLDVELWGCTAGQPLYLPEVPKQGLAACLEFIYTGRCAVADEAELIVVLEAAAYLQIPPLVDAAAKAMRARLSASTSLSFLAVAERQSLSQLAADALSAAARLFAKIAATSAWLSAPAETVRVLLASDRLEVADEKAVYSAAVKWLHTQAPPPAEDDALALLRLVRFPLLSREFVQETVHNEPLLRTVAGRQMLSNSVFDAQHGDSVPRRMGFEKLYCVGGATREGKGDPTFRRYDFVTGRWEAMASMSMADWGGAAAVLGGQLYSMDNSADNDMPVPAAVERYDPATNTWEAVARMSVARISPAAAVVSGKLYMVGGRNDGYDHISSVERYDPEANAWEAVAPMSTGRRWAAAAAIDGKLYVVGGAQKHSTDGLSSVERYDPQSNAWEVVAPHPIGKIYASAAAVLEGKLYVMGGAEEDGDDGELSSVARYDPSTKEWEEVASMSTARRYPTAVVVDGVLHVMGGWAEDCDYLSSVERYDPESDAWVTVAGMALIEGGVGAVAGFQYALLPI